jgi:hypothetical protein
MELDSLQYSGGHVGGGGVPLIMILYPTLTSL